MFDTGAGSHIQLMAFVQISILLCDVDGPNHNTIESQSAHHKAQNAEIQETKKHTQNSMQHNTTKKQCLGGGGTTGCMLAPINVIGSTGRPMFTFKPPYIAPSRCKAALIACMEQAFHELHASIK